MKGQRRRDDNENKFAFWRGSGRGEIWGQLSKTPIFLGNSMTAKGDGEKGAEQKKVTTICDNKTQQFTTFDDFCDRL